MVAVVAAAALAMRQLGTRGIVRERWPVMGTVAVLAHRGGTPEARVEARAKTDAAYSLVERLLSAWNPESELSRLAREGCTNWLERVSVEVRPCYAEALRLAELSGGAFNPRVGVKLRELGVGSGTYSDFDLGAIAKGFAVDLAAAGMRGDADVLVDLGGNLRVVGTGAWRTGVRDPFHRGANAAVFDLAPGESVATSGNYERFIERDGIRYSHILDGRTGEHVAGIAAVTVVTPPEYGAMLADGLSTTLFVLGPEEGMRFLRSHYPRALALWIPDCPDSPRMVAPPEMKSRLLECAWPIINI